MAAAEAIQSGWQNPNDANEATELLEQLQKFGERLVPIQRNIEDANDQASVFASSSVIVSHALLAKLEDLNTRYTILRPHKNLSCDLAKSCRRNSYHSSDCSYNTQNAVAKFILIYL